MAKKKKAIPDVITPARMAQVDTLETIMQNSYALAEEYAKQIAALNQEIGELDIRERIARESYSKAMTLRDQLMREV